MKLLIIEDEPDLLEVIHQSLEMENFLVETAGDYPSAFDKIISLKINRITFPGGVGLG